jgi:hypothetical protein
MGALLLTGFAFSWHNLINRKARDNAWPVRWW